MSACCLLQRDGKQLPGKKGISLPADQFQKLLEAHSALTEALAASDTQFEVLLSGKYAFLSTLSDILADALPFMAAVYMSDHL